MNDVQSVDPDETMPIESDDPAPRRSFRERLQVLLEDLQSPAGRGCAFAIQILILLSVVAFTVQTMEGIPTWMHESLQLFEYFVLTLFTIEYALRAYAATPTRRYVLSWFGLIDLLSILPSLLGFAGLSTLRILRVFRLFRLLKLVRYNKALHRLARAVQLAREELLIFGVIATIVVYLAAVGIYVCENDAQPDNFASVPESLWWAVVTLTTVGYGDTYPITPAGRMFTGVVLITALGIVSIPSGIIASSLTEIRRADEAEREAAEPEPSENGGKELASH